MVRLRLRRIGSKKQPSYRIVVADQRSARNGGFIEIIGFHNPRTEPPTDEIKEDRALYWLSQGAQPSESLAYILKRTGTLDRLARLRQGESMEALVAERAEQLAAAPAVSRRTRYPAPGPGESKIKAAAAKKAADANAE